MTCGRGVCLYGTSRRSIALGRCTVHFFVYKKEIEQRLYSLTVAFLMMLVTRNQELLRGYHYIACMVWP